MIRLLSFMFVAFMAAPVIAQVDKKPTPVEKARAESLKTYQQMYLPQQAQLLKKAAGQWVLISKDQVLPQSDKGKISPAKTLDELLLLAEALVPGAKHRYVFRVGEEGDRSTFYTAGDVQFGVGSKFAEAIMKATESEWWCRGASVLLKNKSGEFKELSPAGSGVPTVPFTIAAPKGDVSSKASFVYCSAFPGGATISPKEAAKLHLELWEVPGTHTLNEFYKCPRALLRFTLKDPKAEVTLPVCILKR